MNPKATDCWTCGCCGRSYLSKELAEQCCVCPTCGKEGTHNGLLKCMECQHDDVDKREEERWNKAKKIPGDSYNGDMVYSDTFEEYLDEWDYESAREFFLEKEYPDEPEFDYSHLRLYGTSKEMLGIDPNAMLETMSGMEPEDWQWSDEAYEDLKKICDEWNAKHATHVYIPDYSIGVVAPDEQ